MKQLITLGAAALSLLAFAMPSIASSTLIQAGTTATPVPELMTDSATGQTGQTGLTGAGIGVKVACSGGVAGQITVAVKVPGTTATAAGQGSVSDEGYGDYAYFPATSETPQTGSAILYVHMTAPSCTPSDAFGQIVGFNPATDLGAAQVAKIGTNGGDSPNAVAAQGQTQANGTSLATANTGISSLVGRPAQTGDIYGILSPLISGGKFTASALSNAPASSGGGTVTVGGYAPGQDPYTLLMAGAFLTIPGDHTTSGQPVTLTYKQMLAIPLAVPASDNASTAPIASGTATTSYYLAGLPAVAANLVYVGTVTYNAAGQQTGRTVKIAQPFPSL